MTCKICTAESTGIFSANVLNKYNVQYYKCNRCGFMQTEQPYWLQEAYGNAITSLDIGLLDRNNFYKPIISNIINSFFDKKGKFVDFGGGYGILVRLLRDAGFDYYRYDIYCENIFSKGFDTSDTETTGKFELLTAFEVFEHLEDPLAEIEKMLTFSDSLLFSTELIPAGLSDIKKWWYVAPETGQHVAFYAKETLQAIADRFGLNLYTNGSTLHLLTPKKINPLTFKALTIRRISPLLGYLFGQNKSLLSSDFKSIRDNLSRHSE